jgi:hypothetical protein
MFIAKIIQSNSHVDYAARILDSLETERSPEVGDYHFGQFVKIPVGERDVVGVIYNSLLINPDYGNFGPRLTTPREHNAVFSPDYLNEQGVLIGVLLLGWRDASGVHQGVPRVVLPINSPVETLPEADVLAFHRDSTGAVQLAYYSHVTTHAGLFAFQLMTAIVDQLDGLANDGDRARLAVLRQSLSWQQTIGKMR